MALWLARKYVQTLFLPRYVIMKAAYKIIIFAISCMPWEMSPCYIRKHTLIGLRYVQALRERPFGIYEGVGVLTEDYP